MKNATFGDSLGVVKLQTLILQTLLPSPRTARRPEWCSTQRSWPSPLQQCWPSRHDAKRAPPWSAIPRRSHQASPDFIRYACLHQSMHE